MVWTARPGGSVDYFNARWHEYTGMTPEESLSGEGWRGVIHPDDLPAMNASRLPAVGSGEAFQAEVRMRNKHGAYRWHLIRSVPVYDRKGQVLQRYGTATDIDDFKRAQEALRESEERFNLAVQGSDAGIWDWDLRTDVVYFSPRWKSMLGYRDDEVENNFREWETRLHPEDRVRARATIDDYLAGRSTEYQLEHRLRHKDDGYRTILSRGAAVRDSSGKPYRMVGWHIDITAHKETVEELNDKLIQLEAAQRIQQSLLPKRPPSLTGIDLAGLSVPAAYAGGDMFDYLPILGGNLGVVIGDVSGHGIGAALQMAATQAFLRSLSQACTTIPEILTRLNQFVCERLEEEYFLTLLLVRLDPRTRTMLYANAGHPTAYVLDPTGAVREELRSESLPIGVQPQTDFPVGGPIHLQPGEIVVLMTDGILEAEAASTEAFGIERLLRVVREHREQTSQEILDALRAAVEAHTGMKEPRDDLTAVIVKVER
jgi:PAS domain S-box-containing protein